MRARLCYYARMLKSKAQIQTHFKNSPSKYRISRSSAFYGLCILLLLQTTAFAAETAKVLPKGIFRARLVGVQTEQIGESINNDSQLEPFANSLNTTVTVGDLTNKDPRVADLVSALNTIQPGLGNNLMNSNLYSDMSLNVTTILPALEYGMTEKLSLGIRLPVVTRRVDANFSANSINNATYAAAQTGGLSPALTAALAQFGAQSFDTAMFAKTIFTDKGYEAPGSYQKTEIGDLEFGGKYNFFSNSFFYATTQLGARAPTGSTPSMTNIFDKGTGGGAWAIGLSMYQEYFPINRVSFGAMQKVSHYFPDTADRAVPKNAADALPSLLPQDHQVQRVTRSQGDKLETELSTTLHFFNSDLTTWGAYQFMTKGGDNYSGPGNLYYDGLAKNSSLLSHSAEIGVGYSTINAYRKKEFSVPGQIELTYNSTLGGRNIAQVNYIRMDMILYF